jgi:GntR family transcriptional repressor for pyruvate dehydrogenase complex
LTASAKRQDDSLVRLPPERDIAQTLGIQRSTLREGLATLTHLGMLRRAPGRGTFVSLPRSDFLQLYFNVALAAGHITIDDLETLREMLEREIVRRAALTADPRDVFELQELARRMESAGSADERLEADYEFHLRLARTTKSRVIELLMDGLSTVLRRVLHHRRFKVRSVPESAERMDATHMPIALAIGSKDVEAAVAAMDHHFSVWSELSKKTTIKPPRLTPETRPSSRRSRKAPVR